MSINWDDNRAMTEADRAYQAVMSRRNELYVLVQATQHSGLHPSGIILPKRLDVAYEGQDAESSTKATLLGKPILWVDGEKWGVSLELDNGY